MFTKQIRFIAFSPPKAFPKSTHHLDRRNAHKPIISDSNRGKGEFFFFRFNLPPMRVFEVDIHEERSENTA